MVALAKSLARKRPGGKRLTLVAISAELAARELSAQEPQQCRAVPDRPG